MSKHGDPDAQVGEFLELEQELSSGHKTAKTYDEGNIAEAAKISASEVPDDYPVPIRTSQALQLNVETPDGETVATYLEWPDETEESDHVEQLLDALGRGPDEFANIYGDRVALDSEDGWHGIDAERTSKARQAQQASRIDVSDTGRNLLGGAVGLAAVGAALTNPVPSVGALSMFVSWVAIPALLYYDGGLVAESAPWEPNRLRWAAAAVFPFLNVSAGTAYLLERHVRLSGKTSSGAAETWQKALVAGIVASVGGFALVGSVVNVGAPLFVFGYLLLPFAVYFDAGYVEDSTDWDPNEELWTAFTVLFGMLGAGAYLVKRHIELD